MTDIATHTLSRRLALLALVAACSLGGTRAHAQASGQTALESLGARSSPAAADIVIRNARVLTMNPAHPQATAIAIRGRYLSAVGGDADVRPHIGPDTRILDVQGRRVIPGLIDAHLHGIRGGQSYLFETYWYDVPTLREGMQRMRHAAKGRAADEWVAVVGSWIPE